MSDRAPSTEAGSEGAALGSLGLPIGLFALAGGGLVVALLAVAGWLVRHRLGEPEPPLWEAADLARGPAPIPGSAALGGRRWPRWEAADAPALDPRAALAARRDDLEATGRVLRREEPALRDAVGDARAALRACERCGLVPGDAVLPAVSGVRLLLGATLLELAEGRAGRAADSLTRLLERLGEGTRRASTLLELMARALLLEETLCVAELVAHVAPDALGPPLVDAVRDLALDPSAVSLPVLRREWVSLYAQAVPAVRGGLFVDWAETSRWLNEDARRSRAHILGRGTGVEDGQGRMRGRLWWVHNPDGRRVASLFGLTLTVFQDQHDAFVRRSQRIEGLRASVLAAGDR